MILRSIRWRLQLWYAVLLAAVILGFGFTAHRLVSINRLRQVDQELQADLAQLGIAVPPTQSTDASRRPPPRPGPSITDQIIERGAYFAVWQSDGSVQARSRNAPAALAQPSPIGTGDISLVRTNGAAREAVHFTGSGRCFLVGRNIETVLRELRQLAWYLAAAGGGVLALGLLGGWWLATRAIRPIAVISDTAEKIATGDLSRRIPTANSDDELGRLANVLNSTFSRLDAAFAQQARFTADAAHELRTPVSVVLMQAQDGLACENLGAEPREAFEACQRAARRMRRLIESLLQLARFDVGQEALKRKPCDLAQIARECVELVRPLAVAKGVEFKMDLREAKCSADSDRVAQVATNLLTNAIEHSREHGEVCISTRAEGGAVFLEVADTGAGIAPEHLPRIFERFYRADAARANGAQRNGLGLAICKAIVEAHGGGIFARSEAGRGAALTLRLPTAA